jgi:cyclophilin family peptidyl-prolyl cis-trans isomerase
MLRRRVVLFLLVATLAPTVRVAGQEAPAATAAGPLVEIPVGIPITLDGRPDSGEWEDAAALDLGEGGPRVRVKQHRGTLLFSMALGRPWPPLAALALYGQTGAAPATFQAVGSVVLDLEPREHNRPHALLRVRVASGWDRRDGEAVVRTTSLDAAATLEAAVPLRALGITGRPTPPLRWLFGWMTPGAVPSHRTFPAGLDLGASPGRLPPGLASTAPWARTDAFPDADGPGAFSPTEWQALLEADRLLTTKGEGAHRAVLAILEGDEAEGSAEPRKEDGPVEAQILDALRWIGARERLTATDLRAEAVGLWALNRSAEAVARMETFLRSTPGGPSAEDFRIAARVAVAAERFEEAALWYEAGARVPVGMQAHDAAAAARMREWQGLLEAERRARAEDAAREDLPLALLETSRGPVLLRLLEDDCPQAVAQFVHLVEATKTKEGVPFYDGTLFHRVVAAGVAQGGDPKSRTEGCDAAGSGGSSWWIAPEKNARHAYFRGSVGFAMGPDGKVRSQFFVVTAPKPRLGEGGYPLFATVAAGMDVVDRLEACDTLLRVRILRKRDHPYEPKKNY